MNFPKPLAGQQQQVPLTTPVPIDLLITTPWPESDLNSRLVSPHIIEQSDECLVLDRVQKFHVCSHGLFRAGFKRFFRTSLQEPVNQNFLTGQIKNFKWNENRAPEHAENLRIKARRTSAVCSGKRSASVRGGETCEKVGKAFQCGPERRSTRTRGINITKECGAAKQQV